MTPGKDNRFYAHMHESAIGAASTILKYKVGFGVLRPGSRFFDPRLWSCGAALRSSALGRAWGWKAWVGGGLGTLSAEGAIG